MKNVPPVEPAPRIEEEPAPPVTPVSSRTRPEEPIATGGFGSWASPAFFQRSRASFGVDSTLDPFAEDDGFVPGKGRKRPRFSMQSREWRLIDEPANPDEKDCPVDWTQELEDETESEPEPEQPEPESKLDKEGIAEFLGTPQETPITTGRSPSAEAIPATTVEDKSITVDRPTPEPSAGVEQPVRQDAARAAKASHEAHEKDFHANGLHIPMDTPRLLPIPSPGLPVPSPLVSADNRQGYFSSAAATIARTSAPQQSTTSTRYESIRVGDTVETRTKITQTKTIEASVAQTTHGGAPISLHETGPEGPVTAGPRDSIAENEVQPEEGHETAATHVYQDEPSPPNMEAPVEENPHIERIATQPPEDVEMDAEQVFADKQYENEEEDDEDFQEDESDEESDIEKVEDESENEGEEDEEEEKVEEEEGEEGDLADQAVNMQSRQVHIEQYATDGTEGPDKTAQSQAEVYSKSKDQRHYIEEDEDGIEDEDEEDEEMDDEEASEGDYESENVYEDDEEEEDIYSESESDGQHQAQLPQKSTQPEIIVLDSDDEDEQPRASSRTQTRVPLTQGQSTFDQEQSDYESHAEQEAENWTSDEQEDGVMAEGGYDDERGHYIENEDDSDNDEEAVAVEEAIKNGDQDHYVEDHDEDDYSGEEEEPVEVEPARSDEQGLYVEGGGEELAEDDVIRDEERVGRFEMVERTRRIENENVEEPASDEQEQGGLAEYKDEQDEQERDEQEVGAAASAVYEIAARPDIDEEQPAGKHHEEAHVTEDLPQQFERDLHEHSPTHTPRETTPEAASYRSETIRDDVGSNERQEVQETSEVRIEGPSTTAELDQDRDSGLWYDGARSPRIRHDTTTITAETLEPSHNSLYDHQADDTVETEYSHQTSVEHSANEIAIPSQESPSSEQAENFAGGDEALVEAADVPEANNVPSNMQQESRSCSASTSELEWAEANEYTVNEDARAQEEQEPRSPSVSVSQHEWVEANEYAADEAQEAADEETSLQLQLQDENRIRESIEETDSYTQQLAGPDRGYPGFRSNHSYYAPLATLIDHFDAVVDTFSVVSEASPIVHSATGNKGYSLTLCLTDPSMVGTTLTAQIFRPYLEALPSVSEGDIILFRNFKVKSFNHHIMLVSADTSAWAVFSPSQDEAQMTGPPVEYDDEERSHVSYLRGWYHSDGAAMVADNQLQASIVEASREMTPMSSVAASDTASLDDFPGRDGRRDLTRRDRRGRKSHRRITIHELRDGRRYTEIGSPSDPESIHELRDGTLYAHL